MDSFSRVFGPGRSLPTNSPAAIVRLAEAVRAGSWQEGLSWLTTHPHEAQRGVVASSLAAVITAEAVARNSSRLTALAAGVGALRLAAPGVIVGRHSGELHLWPDGLRGNNPCARTKRERRHLKRMVCGAKPPLLADWALCGSWQAAGLSWSEACFYRCPICAHQAVARIDQVAPPAVADLDSQWFELMQQQVYRHIIEGPLHAERLRLLADQLIVEQARQAALAQVEQAPRRALLWSLRGETLRALEANLPRRGFVDRRPDWAGLEQRLGQGYFSHLWQVLDDELDDWALNWPSALRQATTTIAARELKGYESLGPG